MNFAKNALSFTTLLFVWSSLVWGAGQNAPPVRSYTGAGSCASGNCHGGVWPKSGGNIDQNEYQTWSTKDRHAKSFALLLEPRSRRIARNLRIERPETSAVCLNCHATNVAENQRASTFDLTDGVSCESCHGPASSWLGNHTTRGWTHEQSLQAGMKDTRSIKARAELCLGCHLGDENRTVDHELIAAGHPDLVFEFESFSALMPVHWRQDKGQPDPMRRWAVGQAVTLRESMKQLSRRARGKAWDGWIEFADFECSACHHELVQSSSRQERGYPGRAGVPPWNESRYLVMRQILSIVPSANRRTLDEAVAQLKQHLQNPLAARAQVAASADRIGNIAEDAAGIIERNAGDPQMNRTLLRAIAADASTIAFAGIRAAEQAAMSVDALYNAVAKPPDDPVNRQIGRLYDLLQSQGGYDAGQFAAELEKLGSLLQ
jgi:hypothetical protein